MQQSQRLKAIEYLFNSNKEKELSYNSEYNLIWEDKMSQKHRSIIEYKYVWFDTIEWVTIYNQISNNSIYWLNIIYRLFKINLYKWKRLDFVENGLFIITRFIIDDSELFLNSILQFIDNEKDNWNVYKEKEQLNELQKDIKKAKGKFDIIKFPLSYNFWKYLSSYNQYYKTLKLLENQYKIIDIQIYGWKISFSLSENKDKEALVEFDWRKIFIDKNPIYFKEMKNWNTTKDLFMLAFSYFTKNKVNEVDFDSLEKYYKENKEQYKWLKTTKFYDEWVRWYVKWKNKKIKLDRFLEVTTVWLKCQYYYPER